MPGFEPEEKPMDQITDGLPRCSFTRLAGLLVVAYLSLDLEAFGQSDEDFKGVIGLTVAESVADFPVQPRPRAGAPNVVFILLDDVGFADLGCFGSEIETPNIDRLAATGLRFNNFHTRAICSPTRAALLTGRNSHAVGLRTVANLVNGFPNGRGRITRKAATLAEILKSAGFSTFLVGKWHLVPLNETSAAGPFDHWPLARGFERFYGFLDGMTDQIHPELVQDQTRVEPPSRPAYHLTEDLIDHAIADVRNQTAVTPDKPFFLYVALGAAHAPHQVAKPYIDKYVPKFQKGWDQVRDLRLARQKQLGIVPESTELSPRNEGVRPWDSLSADEQTLFVQLQAAYAGFLEHADRELGRLTHYLAEIGRLDNTIIVLCSDNGASQEGGLEGSLNELAWFSGLKEPPTADALKRLFDIGTERSFTNYPHGWAMAGNTPFKRYKQNLHGGGSNDPLIISWPRAITDKGAVRTQFVDVIDITPTILDITGITTPKTFGGVEQMPLHGASIARTFADAKAPNPRNIQYFELHGHRALWHDGWKAVTFHHPDTNFDLDRWELYHLTDDFSESKDLALENPRKLAELKDLWWREASAYGVLPLDGRDPLRSRGNRAQPPGMLSGRDSYTYFPGQEHLPAPVAPNLVNRSFSITAIVELPDHKTEGVLLARGDRNGGFALYVKDGRLVFDANHLGWRHTVLRSQHAVPIGKSTLRFEYTRVDQAHGIGVLSIGDQKTAEAEIASSPPWLIAWEGLDVGRDALSPVTDDYGTKDSFAFPAAALTRVDIKVGPAPAAKP
jgi:arylsulfatase A-like enzyme